MMLLRRICFENKVKKTVLTEAVDALTIRKTGDFLKTAIITALGCRNLRAEDFKALYQALRKKTKSINLGNTIIDCCGTGGDNKHYFNVSTTSAFIAAACGISVAKHGGKASSSSSGSSDVLQQAKIALATTEGQAQKQLARHSLTFLAAPSFNPALKQIAKIRGEMGIITIFNYLAPLLHPAKPKYQLLGVTRTHWFDQYITFISSLKHKRILIVSSDDGADELSCFQDNQVIELNNQRRSEYTIEPKKYGLHQTTKQEKNIVVASPAQSLAKMKSVFTNTPGPALDICLLNSAGIIYASTKAKSFEQAVDMARDAVASGRAKDLFNDYS